MKDADWSLRLARRTDAPAIPAIERAAAQTFAAVEGLSALAQDEPLTAERCERLIARGHSLVAFAGDTMAGFLVNEPFRRELHVWETGVLPRHQRRGIGSALMRACLIDARNTGFTAVTLTTFRDIAWNAPLYARLGFEEVTALDAHPRLAGELALEADRGLPVERRCAMICFLD